MTSAPPKGQLAVASLRPERTICQGRCEAIERPDIDPVLGSEVTIAEVHEDASRQPRQFADGAQASQLRRRKSRLRLDFDGQEITAPPEQEVDFSLSGLRGRPVRYLVEQIRITIVGAQDRQDEALKQGAAFLGGDRTQLSLSGASQPRIDPIEFRVLPFSHAQLRLECRQERRHQRVLENAEVSLDRRPRGGGIARQPRNVDHLSVEQRGHGEKPQERG
jgi:hypothetical protein